MDEYLAVIKAFGFAFNPMGMAYCNGAQLGIAQNTALFALLGTTFGGNGQTTFALPDLQGRVIVGQGNGPGLTPRAIGQMSGSESVTLLMNQMPVHNHTNTFAGSSVTIKASTSAGTVAAPSSRTATIGAITNGALLYNNDANPAIALNGVTSTSGTLTINAAGSSLPHDNMQPYTVLNYCIVMQGLFPTRD